MLHPLSLPTHHRATLELAHSRGLVSVKIVTIAACEHDAPLWGRRVGPDLMTAFA